MIVPLWIFVYILIAIIVWRMFLVLIKPTALISGTAKDANGGALAGVLLTLTNDDTGDVLNAVSGADGTYTFAAIKPGNCNLTGFLDNGDGTHYAGSTDFVAADGANVVDLVLAKTHTDKITS